MRPLMLLSLPSSGSTWVSDMITQLPWVRAYEKSQEFFSPITNLTLYEELAPVFGCELPSCLNNIARMPTEQQFEAVVKKFFSAGYNYGKEVFHFYQTPLFVKTFQVFYLHRSTHESFPPKRLRVLGWYDAIATSIETNIGHRFNKQSPLTRAIQAHDYCWQYLIRNYVQLYQLPVMEYSVLVNGEEDAVLGEWLKVFDAEDAAALTKLTLRTRRPELADHHA